MPPPPRGEKRQINILVNDTMFRRLTEMALAAGMPVSTYVRVLFEAAYAARCAPTGDEALDQAVARTLLLHRAGLAPAQISEVVGLPQTAVRAAIDGWRAELSTAAME